MYYDISSKDMELSDTTQVLVHEKLGLLEHLLHDYPAESVMARVRLIRAPMTDEYYHVRVVLELPGDRLYARAEGETLQGILVNVAGQLERQLQHLLSDKRNETHWKRIRRPQTVRHSVPVDEEELPEIGNEVRERTENQGSEDGRHRRAA